MASDYAEKLKDPRWQKKRLEIFERDGWKCRFCDDDKSTLVVHHKDYLPNAEPWDYPGNLLITLCEDCHSRQMIQRDIESDMLHAMHSKFYTSEEYRILQDAFESMPDYDVTDAWWATETIRWIIQKPGLFKELSDKCWREAHGE